MSPGPYTSHASSEPLVILDTLRNLASLADMSLMDQESERVSEVGALLWAHEIHGLFSP